MATRQSNLQEDTRYRVMRILNEQPNISQRELAERLGVSVSGLNYCLKALVGKGFVMVQNFSKSSRKLGYLYVLTPVGVLEKAELTSRFLWRKTLEYEALKKEIRQLQKEIKNDNLKPSF